MRDKPGSDRHCKGRTQLGTKQEVSGRRRIRDTRVCLTGKQLMEIGTNTEVLDEDRVCINNNWP